MKKDCFAYAEVTDYMGAKRIPYTSSRCSCLCEMVCAMHDCSFYRNKQEYEAENVRLYGTPDVEDQIASYVGGRSVK